MKGRTNESGSVGMSIADRIASSDHGLSCAELAKLLGVSERMIFKQAQTKRLPSYRIGTLVRFCPKAVADWLRGQSIGS